MATMDRALFFLSCLWLVICPRFVHSDIYNYVLGKQPSIDKAHNAERLLYELENSLKPWQGNKPILGNPKEFIDSTIQRNPNNPDNTLKIYIGSNPQGSSKMNIPQYPLLENQMNPSFLKWLQQIVRQPTKNPESQSLLDLILQMNQENQAEKYPNWPQYFPKPSTLNNPFISNNPFDENSIGSPFLRNPFNLKSSFHPNPIQKIQINPDNTIKIIVDPNSQGPSQIQIPKYPFLENQINPRLLKWFQKIVRQSKENPESLSMLNLILKILNRCKENPSEENSNWPKNNPENSILNLKWILHILGQPRESPESLKLLKIILQTLKRRKENKIYPNWPQPDHQRPQIPLIIQIPQNPILEYQLNLSLLQWFQQIIINPMENPKSLSLVHLILQILKRTEENPTEENPNWLENNPENSILNLKWILHILGQPRESPESLKLLKIILQTLKRRKENQIYPNWPQPDHQGPQIPLIIQIPQNPILEYQLNLSLLQWFQQIIINPMENPKSLSLVHLILQILNSRKENPSEENPNWLENNPKNSILNLKWILHILGQPRESPESLKLLKIILQTLKRRKENQIYPNWPQPDHQGPQIPLIIQIPQNPILEYQLNLSLLQWFQQIIINPMENPKSLSLVHLILQILKRTEENPTEENPNWLENNPENSILNLKWILHILGQPRESPESLKLLKIILQTLKRRKENQIFPNWPQPEHQGPKIQLIIKIPQNPILEYQLNINLLKWFQQIIINPMENPKSLSLVHLILQILKRLKEDQAKENPNWPHYIPKPSLKNPFIQNSPFDQNSIGSPILRILLNPNNPFDENSIRSPFLRNSFNLKSPFNPNPNQKFQINPDNTIKIIFDPNSQGPSQMLIPRYPILKNQMNPSLLKWLQQIVRQPTKNPESQSLLDLILQMNQENQAEKYPNWPHYIPKPTLKNPFIQNSPFDQNSIGSPILRILLNPNNPFDENSIRSPFLRNSFNLKSPFNPNPNQKFQINPDNMIKIVDDPNSQGPSQYPLLDNQMNPSLLKWLQQSVRQPKKNKESQSLLDLILQMNQENQAKKYPNWPQYILKHPTLKNPFISNSPFDQHSIVSPILRNPKNSFNPNQIQKIQINPDNTLKIIVDPNSQGPSKLQAPQNPFWNDRMT